MSGINTIRLKISGMSCPGCVNNVKGALLSVPGVTAAEVDLKSGEAIIQARLDGRDLAPFVAVVEKAGYNAVIL